MLIADNVTFTVEDADTMTLFIEIASWGFEATVDRKPGFSSRLHLNLNTNHQNRLHFYNADGTVTVYRGIRVFHFSLASPTLLADLKSLVLES